MPGGDDLEDDFVADELVELSEEEGSLHELDDDSNDYADEPTPTAAANSPSDSTVLSKKRKRREKEKEKRLKVRTTHYYSSVLTLTGRLSSRNGSWLR
jgi:protein CMS1